MILSNIVNNLITLLKISLLFKRKMIFSNSDKCDMLRIYYLENRNSISASERYLIEYPERPQPHYSIFNRIERQLRHEGNFAQKRNNYGSRTTEEEVNAVLNSVSILS